MPDNIHERVARHIAACSMPTRASGRQHDQIVKILRREYGESEELFYRVRVWIDKAEELEAKLAKAVEALGGAVWALDRYVTEDDAGLPVHQKLECARETLKEIGDA